MDGDNRNRNTEREARVRRMNRQQEDAPREKRRSSSAEKSGSNELKQKKLLIQIGVIAAAVILVFLLAFLLFGGNNESTPDSTIDYDKLNLDKIIKESVYIDETPVGGLSLREIQELINDRSQHMLGTFKLGYAAFDQEFLLDAQTLGITTNADEVFAKIAEQGAKAADETETLADDEEKYTFRLKYHADSAAVLSALTTSTAALDTDPVDAQVDVIRSSDEANLQEVGKIDFRESVPGTYIDPKPLADLFMLAIENGDNGKIFVPEIEYIEPQISSEELSASFSKMASYSTTFRDSNANRRYNVWKMAGFVNGVILQPGEIWSINEAAGPRYEKYGWKEAAGITDGAYSEQFGGGICQVSSTLYNAVLRAELTIEKRSHHSWPVAYVPIGLDATISTGSPDFIISNPYDIPVVILVNCDAKAEKKITVSIYGPEMDYVVDFKESIITNEEPSQPAATKLDLSLSPGASKMTKERKNRIVVEVYKIKYDKNTGKQLGPRELHHTDTYRAQIGEISYGPSASPSQTATVQPTPTATKTEEKTPEPTPGEGGGEGEGDQN